MSVNKMIAMGRIGKIEQKFTSSGKAITNFSIACSERWKDKNTGQQQEKTEWINCVCFDKPAEIIFQYFKKGSEIFITGKYTTRKWQDQSGQDRYTTEVQVQEFSFTGGSKQSDQAQPSQQQHPSMDDFDDDIPF